MITRKCDNEGTWYPATIHELDNFLQSAIHTGRGYRHVYALRKNLAYNLQYLEFLMQCLNDLKVSSVIEKQIWKNVIIVGCGVIESLLHFLLVAGGHQKKTEWELAHVASGNPQKMDERTVRIDSHIYRKLNSPKNETMTFDSMLKRAEKKKVLGNDHSIHAKLNRLRGLRNRIHLQEIGDATDTDWNAVEENDFATMKAVLHAILTGPVFQPTEDQKSHFAYLNS